MSSMALRNGRINTGVKRTNRFKKVTNLENFWSFFANWFCFVGCILKVLVYLSLLLSLLVLLGFSLLYGYRYITTHSYFALQDIKVTGINHLKYNDVLAITGVSLGCNILDLNISEVERTLAQNPWITSASVRRELPGCLSIHLEERQPTFWVQKDDIILYADAAGKVIAPVELNQFHSLPMLKVSQETFSGEILAAIVGMIQRCDLPFSLGQVAWIHMTSSGDAEFQLDTEGLTLSFPIRDWRAKLTRINAVWQDLHRRGELSRVTAIAAMEGMICVHKKT